MSFDRSHRKAGCPIASLMLGLALAFTASAGMALSQEPARAPADVDRPAESPAAAGEITEALPANVQIVRFQGPESVRLELLGPAAEPVSVGDAQGVTTLGLKVGVGYRFKLTGLPGRDDAELYPVVEVVGHLHRPPGIDPAKYPIRITFSEEDFIEAADQHRLVTLVVYLETPELASPVKLPKGETPIASLTAGENALKVASALGRVMAIVHLGGRAPMVDELQGTPVIDGLGGPCPFIGPAGGSCSLPCGPCRGVAPPAGRPWLPRDEFLCDGGDHEEVAHFGGEGGLKGIDPRDAVLRFQLDQRPRLLPTNMVCIYAPRFALVRQTLGATGNSIVQMAKEGNKVERHVQYQAKQSSRRLAQNQTAEIGRHRSRASALRTTNGALGVTELRVLTSADALTHLRGHVKVQSPEQNRKRDRIVSQNALDRLHGIKTAESAVVSGIAEGTGQTVMDWKPQEMAGVEVPPNKPGLAVLKQVDVNDAEPGDVVTYTIRFKNMGNVAIRSVSVVDSLLPRLEYVAGSATGPKGTVFTAMENQAGSTELRWNLPEAIAPGVEGAVTFRATIR